MFDIPKYSSLLHNNLLSFSISSRRHDKEAAKAMMWEWERWSFQNKRVHVAVITTSTFFLYFFSLTSVLAHQQSVLVFYHFLPVFLVMNLFIAFSWDLNLITFSVFAKCCFHTLRRALSLHLKNNSSRRKIWWIFIIFCEF